MAELPLADRAISEVVPLLEDREVSSRDLVDACLARIERDAGRLNTYLAVGAERALADADVADQARRDGVRAPLLGIPYAL
jgi:Asp-tRNA(Asn)/Glu-tRNA(Gln) amidotransferase A subunit family amidase